MSDTQLTPRASRSRKRVRAARIRQIRLGSGLVLMAYLTSHLVNHALGLLSLAAMETGRHAFLILWRNPLGTIALYGALLIHLLLALWALYQRRRLRMSPAEALQLLLGLSIAPFLTGHIVGTRLAHEWFGVIDSYTYVVLALWKYRPDLGLLQSVVLLVAWGHGCIGVHYWLRLKAWYARWVPVLFGVALLLPVLALLGFVQAGREVSIQAQEPGWLQEALQETNAPSAAARASLNRMRQGISMTFVGMLGLTLIARAVRRRLEPRQETIQLTYPDGQQIVVPVGFTVLEASRLFKIPHASVCGGRGRCSTCRIRVIQGADTLPAATPNERRVLDRISAPPSVRLACQVRPHGKCWRDALATAQCSCQ